MNQLEKECYVKKDNIGPPELYLGMQVKRVTDRQGKSAYATSCTNYVDEVVKVVESRMQDFDFTFYKSAKNPSQPFSYLKYNPELDISDFCKPDHHQCYQQMVGIMRWMIEIGRLDITTEVSLMLCYLSQPRMGHLV